MATREQIWQALFAKLQTVSGFTIYSRRLNLQPGVNEQPALYLSERNETHENPGIGTPAKRTFHGQIVCFYRLPDKTTPCATIINPFLDAIEAVFAPDNLHKGEFTLGGLVYYCRIEGEILKDSADIDPEAQGLFVVPIKIMVP